MGAEEAVRALLDTEGWSLRDGAILAASQRARGERDTKREGIAAQIPRQPIKTTGLACEIHR